MFRVLQVLGLIVLFASTAFAKVDHLLDVKTDIRERGKQLGFVFQVEHTDGVLETLIVKNNATGEVDKYKEADVRKGIILYRRQGFDVVKLGSKDFTVDRGGHFVIDYLKNGLKNERAQIEVEAGLEGETWGIFYQGDWVETMRFFAKKTLGMMVGVDRVEFKFKR